ncbi:hypothetical protein KNO15_13500 [Leifsonia shinshuensis]|uniref:hypothetical protein n=1 Tax=Leifsonia shinshuensis TaxID=150026 RepID=UPI001F514D47|nr:hypothetical protein [Leifsonia shinshuensis]MCI0157710.1 hypothetical protein [Leifsonia shinshuensis]
MSTSAPSTALPNPPRTHLHHSPLPRLHRLHAETTASPVELTARFLIALVGTDVLASMPANRAALSDLLDLEVTEHGYRLLVAPMVGGGRPTPDAVVAHTGWWFRQLP